MDGVGSQDVYGSTGADPKKLIEAAVGAVDGDSPAPPELRLGWNCDRFNCLPDAGGYLDQDYSLMHKITTLMNIHAAYSHYRNSSGTQIHSLSDSERRILRVLKDMDVIFKA